MARGFLSGIVWGTVVGGLGAIVLSQVTELPPSAAEPPRIEQQEGAESAALEGGGDPAPPEQPATDVDAGDVPLIGLTPPGGDEDTAAPAPDREPEAPPEPAESDVALATPEAGEAPRLETGEDGARRVPEAGLAPTAPEEGEAPRIATGAAEAPAPAEEPEAGTGEEDAAPAPAAEPQEGDGEVARLPETAEDPAIRMPVPEISDMAPDVTTDRLPSIGDEGDEEDEGDAEGTREPEPGVGALARFATPFENPEGRPLYSVVLIDSPDGALTPEEAAALPLPLTFAIDPTVPGAAERAEAYRAAGHEVLILLSLPEAAQPRDVEVALESAADAVPGAVGLLDAPEGGFGSDRMKTRQIVDILSATGHGLLSYDRGLNAARQLAERAGVPSALVYRVFDDEHESPPVIGRYLDRAAFRAQQEGQVVMVGHLYADTVEALAEWALGERASGFALAPVSAILRAN